MPDTILGGAGPIYVVEGPSDVAAATALGLLAIGRPSNSGGAEHVAGWVSGAPAGGAPGGPGDRRRERPETKRDVAGPHGAYSVARRVAGCWASPSPWP